MAATANLESVEQLQRLRANNVLPYLLAVAVLVSAVVAGIIVGSGGNSAVGGILNASSSTSNFLGNFGDALPFGFAFAAGMVSTVNPCGFMMLPAYLGLYVGTQDAREQRPNLTKRLFKASTVSVAVGMGFVVLFGTAGIVISAGAQSIVDWFPWIGLGVGAVLTIVGGYIMSGGKLYTSFATQTASRIGDPRDASMKGYFLFGLSYATASLSCTLPIFIALISSSLATGTFIDAAGQFFVYALGMSFVITVLTLSLAMAQNQVATGLKKILPHTNTISSVLLLVAGGYIVFYWLTEGGLADKII
ncbi:MAG: cytochrome c biogenesis protein CcdA [Chloroflexi bacterium]|nr:cytochrome c biogenesis protein CcdA [Chloroflexota bacterium]MCH8221955.1 cytochrome c biogenesis protein CcdA [Chloroflexota bacterium]